MISKTDKKIIDEVQLQKTQNSSCDVKICLRKAVDNEMCNEEFRSMFGMFGICVNDYIDYLYEEMTKAN